MSTHTMAGFDESKPGLDECLTNGPRYNSEWAFQHPEHYLSAYANASKMFAATCCELTVEMLKARLCYCDDATSSSSQRCCCKGFRESIQWEIHAMPESLIAFKQILRMYPVIQVAMYPSDDDGEYNSPEHTLIIYQGHSVLQSFYRKHTLKSMPVTDIFLSSIVKSTLTTEELRLVDPFGFDTDKDNETSDGALQKSVLTTMYWIPSRTLIPTNCILTIVDGGS